MAVAIFASNHHELLTANWSAAGPDFFKPFPQPTALAGVGFFLGFAAAALGFDLGQPQMVTRYLAGATPEETRSAWWIYLTFVHLTWIAMTVFGMLLRGVMPDLADPEMGLSVFFRTATGPLLTGLIAADIFATIAAATNSLLVALAQTVRHDLLDQEPDHTATGLWPYTLSLGLLTLAAALLLHGSVFGLAITSAALIGAALAPNVAARALGLNPPAWAILSSIGLGFATALAWRVTGLGGAVNEALPGIIAASLPLLLVSKTRDRDRKTSNLEA